MTDGYMGRSWLLSPKNRVLPLPNGLKGVYKWLFSLQKMGQLETQ